MTAIIGLTPGASGNAAASPIHTPSTSWSRPRPLATVVAGVASHPCAAHLVAESAIACRQSAPRSLSMKILERPIVAVPAQARRVEREDRARARSLVETGELDVGEPGGLEIASVIELPLNHGLSLRAEDDAASPQSRVTACQVDVRASSRTCCLCRAPSAHGIDDVQNARLRITHSGRNPPPCGSAEKSREVTDWI